MSKVWQDFWTFAFMAAGYGYTIIACFGLLKRPDVPPDKKGIAGIVLVLWIIVIPLTLMGLGAGPELWKTFSAPFR